jgi:hypothetical protein
MRELKKSKMSDNFAIRHLEFLANNYAKHNALGRLSPDHADEYKLWSKAALKAKRANPNRKYGEYLRVEHGTPRRRFAKMVYDTFQEGALNQKWMDKHCRALWRVAVITHEEDRRLNKLKKREFDTPEERWAEAGIQFP